MGCLFCKGGESKPSALDWVSSCIDAPLLYTYRTALLYRHRFSTYLFVDLISLSVSPCFLSSSPKAKQQGTLDLFLSKPGGYVP